MASQLPPSITLAHISKRYSGTDVYALQDVSLEVFPGEIYGFLGANGAGKTTTIRVLLNFLQPTGGVATIIGHDAASDSVRLRHHIGYLAGDVSLYEKASGRDMFAYLQALQPLKSKRYFKELTERFEAELDKPIGSLSKGNKQKLGIIQAFMHQPDVLILDEPTGGLDPVMQEVFYQALLERKQAGAAVFMSSHNLSEVQHVCDRVGFIKGGKLVAERTIAELAEGAAHTFDITFKDKAPLAALKGIPLVKVTHETGSGSNAVTVELRGGLSQFFGILSQNEVLQIDQREVNLAKEFHDLYEKGSE